MARKKKYIPKPFESKGETFIDENGKARADTSANIYESMLLSRAFMTLTSKQQILYIYCKSQYYGHRKPEKDFPDIEQFQGADIFYLNWNTVKKYGLYKDSMHSNFYKDMKALCEHGFIENISSGKSRRTKTVYRFNSEWRTWTDEKAE